MKVAADLRKRWQFPWPRAVGLRDLGLVICGGVLVLAPLAYGAVHPWAYAMAGLTLSLLSIILLAGIALVAIFAWDPSLTLPRPPLWGLVLAAVLLVLGQLIPLPQEVVGWLSPRALQIRSLGNGYGLAPLMPLSMNSNATIKEILLVWPAVVLFFLLVFMVNSHRQIKALTFLLLGVAFFEALYGLWHFQSHLIWGWKNPYYLGRLCGTFINSNHAAGYLAMAVLLGFGLFLAREKGIMPLREDRRSRNWVRFWSKAEHLEPLIRHVFFFLPLLILLVAFFFTASRGASFALGVGLTFMVVLWRGQHSDRWPLYLLAFFLLGVILYCWWLGGSWVFTRFLDLSDQGRYIAFWGSLRLFREFPLVGAGLGTFDDLSYTFVLAALNRTRLIYAHNDWAQLLAETGVVGFLIVGGGWCLFYFHLIRVWRQRRENWARGLGLGGLAALTAGAFHALGEFPFRIPAYSLTYAAIAALTFITLHHHRKREHFDYASWRPAGNRLVPWLCAALVLGQMAYMGQAWYFWQAERAAPLEIDSTRIPRALKAADYSRALALNPRNAGYYAGLALTLEPSDLVDPKWSQEIEGLLQQAIFQAPARWRYHFQLGNFLLRHYQQSPKRHLPQGLRELAAAVALFPEKAKLHLQLGLALSWTELIYPAYVPPELTKRAQVHLDKAVALEPALQRFVNPREARE